MLRYDVIICVGWKDVFVVKKTIEYVRKNLQADVIYLILNREDMCFFDVEYCSRKNIVVIDEDKLINGVTLKAVAEALSGKKSSFSTGWYFQQFLKIGFSLSPYAKEYYLIWDADTLPLSHIPFEKNGKLLYTMKKEYHKPYFDVIESLWGLKKQNDFSFIAEHMIIKTSIMKELISAIQPKNSNDWITCITKALPPDEQNCFSEFESYGTYVNHYYPELYLGRTLNSWRNAGFVFGRNIRHKDIELLSIDFDLISLEAWCGKFFPTNLYGKMQEIFVKIRHYHYLKKHGLSLQESIARKIVNLFHKHDKLVKL